MNGNSHDLWQPNFAKARLVERAKWLQSLNFGRRRWA